MARKVRQTAKRTMDDVAMTPFLRKITFFSSGGSFLDGYVLSLIGVALTQIVPAFGLTDVWSAAIGASVLVGIFVGTITGGYLTDAIGRKKMFIIRIWVAYAGCSSLLSVFVAEAGSSWPPGSSSACSSARLSHRHVAHRRVHAQGASVDLHGNGVGGVVSGRHRGRRGGLRALRRGGRLEMDARQRRGACVVLLVGRHDIPESPLWLASKGAMPRRGP